MSANWTILNDVDLKLRVVSAAASTASTATATALMATAFILWFFVGDVCERRTGEA